MMRPLALALLLIALLLPVPAARGEVIEEIVARVNDDPVTRSDLQVAEQEVIEDIRSKKSGESLDRDLTRAKSELLRDLITKRLLVQKAERMFDITKMEDAFLRQFKEQQKIATTTELEKVLKDEGYTLDEFKKKMIEVNAPGTVIDTEVRSKVSVSDAEVESFYKEHASTIASPERVYLSEIILKNDSQSGDEATERARSIALRARAEGADFAQIAKETSEVEEKLRGIPLGPFTKGELAPPIEVAVFAMKAGAVSDPIVVGATIHIVRLDKLEESVMPPLDSVKEKIAASIERQKFDIGLEKYLTELWGRADICVADEYIERLPVEFRKYVKC